jgi:hypothetical protein
MRKLVITMLLVALAGCGHPVVYKIPKRVRWLNATANPWRGGITAGP